MTYIVGCRGASQLGGSLLGIPPGYKANKLYVTQKAKLNELFVAQFFGVGTFYAAQPIAHNYAVKICHII